MGTIKKRELIAKEEKEGRIRKAMKNVRESPGISIREAAATYGLSLWGGPCQKIDIEEVEVRPSGGKGSEQGPERPDAWEKEIGRQGEEVLTFSRTAAFWKQGMLEAEHL